MWKLQGNLSGRVNLWLLKFFRARLLTFKTEAEIIAFLDSYDREVKAFKEELLRMCWFMRGGVTYSEIMQMGQSEREIIANIIKSNLEITKESKVAFF